MEAKEKHFQEYRTVACQAEAEIIEKKSRFIAHVKPVTTEEEAVAFIHELKSKYWDASHNVYAYVLGNNNIQRYSDDGEPSGTAGVPTLEVIKKEGLQDVVVVVTRYFGGTLLGAGGLVRAYGKSAKEGLVAAKMITRKPCRMIKIKVDYNMLGKVQNEIVNAGHIIENTVYEEDVTITVLVDVNQSEKFVKNMVDVTSGRVTIETIGSKYVSLEEKEGV